MVSGAEMPYYFDVVTYIGAGEQIIGSFPEEIIREETVRLKQLKETISDVEIEKREKSMKNGAKVYNKSKKSASRASAQRAKVMSIERHPMFKREDD
mmetsp:Transcript_8890/g.1279  ORF Transcript_8890/g.1279 Transcript_8890/m.1279 type:complete len:97 (+) Transcript_8890:1048-1338(+)